ncbi:ATP-binding protein [Actinoplanes sp. NEAU-A12]|uniref:histidine kinase n=1 Tax=Actinoplanes sandaracinus TaxID=3045177 RepID=A0ABT6WVN5_9ACTN|nr:ATP-binding protein [Actinoplanes sandaracinus]MDI6103808.1 ATP-binding protein [Actinoplanes sandaracinus]
MLPGGRFAGVAEQFRRRPGEVLFWRSGLWGTRVPAWACQRVGSVAVKWFCRFRTVGWVVMACIDAAVLESAARVQAAVRARGVLPVLPLSLDAVARMAARMLRAPMAVVAVVGAHEEEFLGMFGMPAPLAAARRTDRENSVCAYVVSADAMLAVGDMPADADFATHPWVSRFGVRSFAGLPLRDVGDRPVGALIVADIVPRVWTDDGLSTLVEITDLCGPVPAGVDPGTAMTVLREAHDDTTVALVQDGGAPATLSAIAHAEVRQAFITALLDSLQVGVFAVDAAARPVMFNRTLRRFYRLSEELGPADALTAAHLQLRHCDGRPYTTDDLAAVRALRGHGVRDVEALLHSPGIPDRYLLINAEPIRNADGDLLGAVSTIQDVTTRRRGQRFRDCGVAVAQILSRCDTVTQAAPAVLEAAGQALEWHYLALLLVDEVADVLRMVASWSAPGVDLDGLVPQVIARGDAGLGHVRQIGQPLWLRDLGDPAFSVASETRTFGHAASARGLHAGLIVAIHNGDTVLGVLAGLCATAESDEFLITGLLDDVAGQLAHFLADRRATESDLQLAYAKDDFLSLIGHEMRTPLTSILSYSTLLSDEVDDPELRPMVEAIGRNTAQLQAIIDRLLELAGLESGHITLHLTAVDLVPIVTAAVAAVPQPETLRIHTTLPPTLIVHADPHRLRQIIDELLSNAVKYSPAGGDIHISAHAGDGVVEVVVTDPGIGIPRADQDRLFARFHRGSNARHSSIGGTGLGLALVRTLAQAHGGVVLHDPGHHPGTSITVRLPQHP